MNPFSTNSEASAWSDKESDFLFNRVHSHIALHLGECCILPPGGVLVAAPPLRFIVRCHPEEAEKLWGFVHQDSILKEWEFNFDGSRSRLHSATELKCLKHVAHLFSFDHRLIFCMETGSPIAALNFPLKRIQSAHLMPPGAVDSTGAVANLPNKIAS